MLDVAKGDDCTFIVNSESLQSTIVEATLSPSKAPQMLRFGLSSRRFTISDDDCIDATSFREILTFGLHRECPTVPYDQHLEFLSLCRFVRNEQLAPIVPSSFGLVPNRHDGCHSRDGEGNIDNSRASAAFAITDVSANANMILFFRK
jgi:hypothetical protein